MNAKKRKQESSSDLSGVSPAGTTTSVTRPDRQLATRRGTTDLSKYSWYNPAFRRRMHAHFEHEGRILTGRHQATMASFNIAANAEAAREQPPVWYMDEVAEYLRRMNMIRYLFELKTAGDICSFGNDDAFQLGQVALLSKPRQTMYLPRFISTPLEHQQIRQVAAGGLHSVACTVDGNVYSWGARDDGVLGRNAQDPVGVAEDMQGVGECTPTTVTGFYLRNGQNVDGTIVAVSAGDIHILYLTIDGHVFMTGCYKDMDSGKFRNPSTELGSPQGSHDRPVHIPMPNNARVLRIDAGYSFNAAILDDETVVTWGMGHKGELARSENMTNPDRNGQFDLGKPFCYEDITDENGNIRPVPNDFIVREHFLTPKKVLWDIAPVVRRSVLAVACGGFHILVCARDVGQNVSRLYSSGLNNYGQLGLGDSGGGTERHKLTLVKEVQDQNITKVAAGEHFSLCLNAYGSILFSFGRADYGQCGIDTRKAGQVDIEKGGSLSTPTIVQFPGNERVMLQDIACGDRHSLAVTMEQELYTWGFGETGLTGHETIDSEDVYIPTKLNLQKYIKKHQTALVYNVSGGGQHTLIVANRYG